MSNDSIKISQIEESLISVFYLSCDICFVESVDGDYKRELANALYSKGWRVADMGAVYCSDCAKKFNIE